MEKLPIGSRIKINKAWYSPHNSSITVDQDREGKILKYTQDQTKVGIEFDRSIFGGDTCHSTGKYGYCLYVPIEIVELLYKYNIGDTVFLTENVGGVPKGHKMEIEQLTQRDYAPYIVTTQIGTSRLIVTELQISKQEPVQILDIKSTQDKRWRMTSDIFHDTSSDTKKSFKSSKPMLAVGKLNITF